MIINEDEVFVKSKPSNPWARISEVAAKVGVKPCGDPPPPPQWANVRVGSAQPTIKVTGADGKQYDVWEVIIAVLDKMEEKL